MEKTQDTKGKGKPFDRLKKWLKTYFGLEDGIALALMLVGILCYIFPPNPDQNKFYAFLFDFRAEFLGAGIATLLIGNASQAAQIKEEKKRLILQMGSPDNSFAIEAVRQLGQHGWLKDGTLKGANFYKANLSQADLSGANLSKARLTNTNLSGAQLGAANLCRASLFNANLSQAHLDSSDLSEANLLFATLSGSKLIRANLSGATLIGTTLIRADLGGADLSGTKFCDEKSIVSAHFDNTTQWEDAFYTQGENGTVFPKGFNPTKFKMHLILEGESFDEAYKRVDPFGEINIFGLD